MCSLDLCCSVIGYLTLQHHASIIIMGLLFCFEQLEDTAVSERLSDEKVRELKNACIEKTHNDLPKYQLQSATKASCAGYF